jgi:hypothetical protein
MVTLVPRRVALSIAFADVFLAAMLIAGVFFALPSRWWPVDLTAATLAAIQLASAVGLFAGAPWAARVARVAGAATLAVGMFTVTTLAVTASWLSGVYGPVGLGGALVLALVAALVLPYLVALPVLQLLWLRPDPQAAARAPD